MSVFIWNMDQIGSFWMSNTVMIHRSNQLEYSQKSLLVYSTLKQCFFVVVKILSLIWMKQGMFGEQNENTIFFVHKTVRMHMCAFSTWVYAFVEFSFIKIQLACVVSVLFLCVFFIFFFAVRCFVWEFSKVYETIHKFPPIVHNCEDIQGIKVTKIIIQNIT